jgi:hypothetical protein
MNTGQTLLTVCAMVLLATTVLTVNGNNLNQAAILRQTEIGLYAIGLATSYFEKASNLDFDNATVGNNKVYSTTELSTALGPDAGEIATKDSTFNDFDDYNGFDVIGTDTTVDRFEVKASVYYLNGTAPYAKVATPYTTATTTWLKQMEVWVIPTVGRQAVMGGSNTAGIDTVNMKYIYSYYQ